MQFCSEYICDVCSVTFRRKCDYTRHLATSKHIRTKSGAPVNDCICCAYTTNSLYEWNRHIQTKKHKRRIEEPQIPLSTYITNLIEENKEMREFLIDEFRKLSADTSETQKIVSGITLTQNINHRVINNKFNINVFLNEQCKDAENMTDFIQRIVVSREDLENNAQLGFVNGISKIFIDNLRQLDIRKRPIHCTDIKRETIYIKEDDKWTKEDDDVNMRKAVQEISRKSVGTLIDWKQTNPDYVDGDSEFSAVHPNASSLDCRR